MRAGFFTSLIFTLITGLAAVQHTLAQISGVTYPAAACTGQSVSVQFTAPAGAYTIQLVPTTGPAINLGTATSSPANVTIPGTGVAAGNYKIKIFVTATPATSATGALNIAITSTPAVPGVVTPVAACAGAAISLSATGSNLKWYSSTGTLLASPPATAPATAGAHTYQVSQSTGSCEGPKAEIIVNVTEAPATPTLAAAPSPVCQGTTVPEATFTGAVATGTGTLVWYSQASGGSPLSPGSITVSTTTAGEKSLYVARKTGSCESGRLKVSIVVNAIPGAPSVTTPVNACVGTTPAPVLNATGTDLKWYSSAGAALPSKPVISTAAAAASSYGVTQTVNGCESEKATIAVNVSAIPPTPVIATPPAAVCAGAVVPSTTFTNAIAAGTGTLVWYSAASGGTPLTGADVTVNTGTAGVKSLYVARKQGDCESPRLKVDITVKPLPSAPGVAALDVCVGDTPAPVLTATGTALKWYNSAGTAIASAPTIPTAAAATFTYQVSQTVDGCESAKATITAKVHKTAAPVVTSSIAYCKGETPAALTATGTALKWYTSASGGTGTATPPTVSTATVGTVAYYVTQTLNGCESEKARIDVRTKAVPVVPVVANIPDVCQASTVSSTQLLNAVTTATGTLKWYTAATGGTGTAGAPTPVTTASGTQNYYVTQSVEGCESPRANIKMEVKALPAAPSITATVDLCHQATSSTPLTATATGTNTLKWYNAATGGNALASAPVPATSTVQTTSYYVSQVQAYSTSLSCESTRARINVVVNPLPAAASSTDQVVCQTRNDQTLNFSAATNGSGNSLVWYPNATTAAAETAVPSRNLKTPGEFEYFVAQKSAKECIGSRKAVKIRVKRLPGLPVVSNLEYCQFENTPALSAGLENSATPNWYGLNATGGTASPVAPSPSTAEGGTFSYYVSQTLEACEGDRAEIRVLVKTTPKPETQTEISYCHNAPSTQLSATGQRLMWYRPNGEKQTTPFTPFTASVGDQFFYVTQTGDNNCESPKQEIKITVYPLPSATISGQSSIPLGGTASIQITFTGMGPWSYKLSNGYSGTSESNTVSIQVQPSFTTSYLVTEVSNSCGNGTPNGSAVVTVLRPTITTGNPNVVSVCAGSEIAVPIQRSGDFPSGSKFVLQIARENKEDSFKTIETKVSGNTLTSTLPDTLEGGTYFVRAISENPNPDLSTIGSVSGVNILVDPKPTATLPDDRTILEGQSTTLSIGLTGAAPWTFSYSNGSETNSVTTSTSPYMLNVTPAVTAVYTITSIENKCGAGRSIGETRVQVDKILGVEPAAENWVKVLPTVTYDYCKVELDVPGYEGIELKIVDLSGRTLRTLPLNSAVTDIHMGTLPSGIYFFQVRQDMNYAVIKVLRP
ncbi:MAG: hypothetical protein ABS46_03840 [Cytophagaceae bacterium SCN 52-12]|nr:MAG: hypothetical protein ABS46_03840 [Cytophagaceae bacterium SCN 52-12]